MATIRNFGIVQIEGFREQNKILKLVLPAYNK